jgi:phosphoglycerate dehydrogenase-like enzyme
MTTNRLPPKARIFMVRDSGLAKLLDEVDASLTARQHIVTRGPMDAAGSMRRYTASEAVALIGDADVAVFTGRHSCSAEVMSALPGLRGICFPAIGVESLDLAAANELGLIVGHGAVRGNIIGMAESNVMLMLMLLYDVETNIRLINGHKWRRPGHHSRQMEGKTIGLIGFGRIAREIAQRLLPFGVKIITYSPRADPKTLPAGVEKVTLEALLRDSDVVSILTGLTPETLHMIDASKLALMKPDAYLINTARGAVVDEPALYQCLRDKRIAGAALDTFVVEPLPDDSPLFHLDNVILTPHCVGHTVEGYAEFGTAMVENIERIMAGELPLYCKNPEAETAWRNRLTNLAGGAPAVKTAGARGDFDPGLG